MPMQIFGSLTSKTTLAPVSGAKIVPLINIKNDAAQVAAVTTDANGKFTVALDDRQLTQFDAADAKAYLFFRVFFGDNAKPVLDTHQTLQVPLAAGSHNVDLAIETPVPPRHIRGAIRNADGTPAAGVIVVGRTSVANGPVIALGTAITDADGAYIVEYLASVLGTVQKADVFVTAYADADQRIKLGASGVLHGAGSEALLDLILPPRPSEYEDYIARIQPRLKGRELRDLDDAAISDLAKQTGIAKESLSLLAASARIAFSSGISEIVVYGLVRTGLQLEQMYAAPDARIREGLNKAQGAKLIPKLEQETIDSAVRILQVLRAQRTPLTDLASVIGIDPANSIFSALARNNIKTLADVRKSGGLASVKDLGIPGTDPALQRLDSHARLLSLQPDVAANSKLIGRGYNSLTSVARATPQEISAALGLDANNSAAAELRLTATVQSTFLRNLGIGDIANPGRGQVIPLAGSDVVPEQCGCEDCAAAVSPRAYLADLMQYAITHLRFDGVTLDLRFFKDRFHQPFSDLPSNCGAQNKEVRQVRICIEVLRAALGARPLVPPAREATLKKAERQYLLDTYLQLLTKLGTSYSEIRLSRGATQDEQRQLANQIGVPASALASVLLDPATTPAQLTEAALEKIFGLVDTTQPPLRNIPASQFQTWRLSYLRDIWKSLDWPSDGYAERKLAIIDPDLIGPDDFRYPAIKAHAADPDKAFDIWVRRRVWADGLVQHLKAVPARQAAGVAGPDFSGIVAAMSGSPYNGNAFQWPAGALDDIRAKLAAITAETTVATTDALYNTYRLTLDAARRLIELWAKDNAFWKTPDRAPAVADDEWNEVDSILLRVQKNDLAGVWMKEESDSVVARATAGEIQKVWAQDADAGQGLLGQREFWDALKNPFEGDWPPVRSNGVPLIDPEEIKLEDLPDPTAGSSARNFWTQRDAVLKNKRDSLLGILNSTGVEDVLAAAFGAVPQSATSWTGYLRKLEQDLLGSDKMKADAAATTIEQSLKLTVDGFERMLGIMTQLSGSANMPLPALTDLVDLVSMLTTSWKQKTLYPTWYGQETAANTGVPEWLCARLALSKWRAGIDERVQWKRALDLRSQPAIIDPDNLVSTGYLKTPGQGNAWAIWDRRQKGLAARQQAYAQALSGANRTAVSFNNLADTEIGVGVLDELATAREDGKGIASRAQQLNLSSAALDELLQVRALLTTNPPVTVLEEEWTAVCSILTQVWKQRQLADWQLEERTQGIVLSQDHFQLLPVDLTQVPTPLPPTLDPWRGAPDNLLDWQDKLQSRLDQESSVIASLDAAVSDVEQQTLPPLRDALVAASIIPGITSATSARSLGDQLGISTEYAGCDMTTRVSQAIETFQIILWGLRTGLLAVVYPGLTMAAPDFDEEWTWIGSYATWRAAMFVFLYPENIALPSLRRAQTPAFRRLVDNLRNIPKLTAAKARDLAENYAEYARDIFTLEIVATPVCLTHTENGDQNLTYLFATSRSGTVYWANTDPTNNQYPYSFWDAVPGLQGNETVIGADSYLLQNGHRYLYLFLQVDTSNGRQLAFNRYDLRNRRWEQDTTSLKPPEDAGPFSSVLRQRSANEKESPIILFKTSGQLFYERALDKEGTDWQEGDWIPMDRVWARWTSDSSSPRVGTNLVPGRRFFATVRESGFGRIAAPGSDGQVHSYAWYGTSPFSFDPPRLLNHFVAPLAGVSVGNGGITGFSRTAPSPNWPSAVPQIDLFLIGSNQGIYNTRWDLSMSAVNGGWQTQWHRIVSATDAALEDSLVTVVSRSPGMMESFVHGTDNGIYQTTWSKDTGFTWTNFNRVLSGSGLVLFHNSELAMLAMSSKHLVLLVMVDNFAPNGMLVGFEWTDTNSWQAQNPFIVPSFDDVSFSAPVTLARRSENVFRAFVPRTSGSIWTAACDLTAKWGEWEQIGDRSTRFSSTAYVSACNESDHVLAFAIDQAGTIQSSWQRDGSNGGKWYSWAPVQANSAPAFVSDGYVAAVKSEDWLFGNKVTLFSVAADGTLYWIESSSELPGRDANASSYWASIPDLPYGASVSDIVVTDKISDAGRVARPALVKSFYDANQFVSKSTLAYLEELFYFVPVHLALQLQRSGVYIEALDWLRLIYDYTSPLSPHLVGLPPESQSTTADFQCIVNTWLLDPLNPHTIAETRHGAYTRFTLLAIINCLLAYADDEFTADTSETVPRARELYERVLALVESEDLRQTVGTCDQIIGNLQMSVDDPHWEWIKIYTKTVLSGISEASLLKSVVAQLTAVFNSGSTAEEQVKAALPVLKQLSDGQTQVVSYGSRIGDVAKRLPLFESAALGKQEIASALESNEINTLARNFTRPGGLGVWDTTSIFSFCVPPNPLLRAIKLRAELNLYKINNWRNIAGVERELEPFAAPTDTSSGMPTIGAGGQLVVPGLAAMPSTPYRYSALIDRAKQLAQQAMQMEAAFLASLEKTDKEAYDLLNAKADVRLAQAGLRLQDLQVQQAQDSVELAQLQRERSSIQSRTYQDWISAGLSPDEQALLGWYDWLEAYQIVAVQLGAAVEGMTGGVATGVNPYLEAAFQIANAGKAIADSLAINAQIQINKLSVLISLEQKVQEWSLQKALADQDIRIGDEQVQIANEQVRVSQQQRMIDQMKADHAQEVVDFLANKFTNKELYDWMSGVLQGVYSFFLQQATSVAQQAASQLAFERQETPPAYIQTDYWQTPDDHSSVLVQPGNAPDRRGLTGSARLLQDIYQLDQYAFEKNSRKQQLTKTFSLVQLDPFAFQQFLETGVLPFATPMDLFDRDFPGHYLRLIKRIRTTVVALVPPNQGIRATLTSSGISRVVLGGDIFQTEILRRPPEMVALSAPFNSTGLFDLQEQPDMLLPFEDLGVATSWELSMPKAANPFDYSSIADVLVTMDYTALNSFDYRQQVIQRLNAKLTQSADRAFSFRMEFADAWYDLNNPDQSNTPMSVTFEMARGDFPPNLDNLRISQIALYLARPSGSKLEFAPVDLRFQQAGGGSLGGAGATINGLISTRAANGSPWLSLVDSDPTGNWCLTLPNTEETKNHFQSGDVTDILFVITYTGRAPEWPA